MAAGREEGVASMQAEVDKWKERAVELERQLEVEAKWREAIVREKKATAGQNVQVAKWRRRSESKEIPTAGLVLGSHGDSD